MLITTAGLLLARLISTSDKYQPNLTLTQGVVPEFQGRLFAVYEDWQGWFSERKYKKAFSFPNIGVIIFCCEEKAILQVLNMGFHGSDINVRDR